MNDPSGDVPALREFTLRAIVAGLVFGAIFGAANAYLGLKAGLTVSTSIPIAVLSVLAFRLTRGRASILEANISQTIGSASSSLASGTIFTIPALFLWGAAPSFVQIAVLALLGGVLGILAMVPLRRLLIVRAADELPYPEGRACAEVLRASEGGASGASWIVIGIALGALLKVATTGWHLMPEETSLAITFLPNAKLTLAIAPALLAVGFIVGFRASAVMFAGALITSLVLYPLATSVWHEAKGELLSAKQVKDRFLIFVGAGAIAAAGIFTVVRTAPTMVASLLAVVRGLRAGGGASEERTDRDLPPAVLGLGLLAIALVAAFVPGVFAGDLPLAGRIAAAAGILVFGFVFVPVSSRLVGVIGVSSNPTSAMALITLVGTALAFLAFGFGGDGAKAAVLTVGTVVCVAASKAGDISQDLKTGHLVGGTPALQQFGQLIAAAVACWAVAGVVYAIGHGIGFGDDGMRAPQANLMKTVVEAVLGATLPWQHVGAGAALGIAGIVAGLPALPLALGLYLPMGTMAAIFAGGCARRFVESRANAQVERGVLCASGFVAGEGLAGVLIAAYALATGRGRETMPAPSVTESLLALACLLVACVVLVRATRKR